MWIIAGLGNPGRKYEGTRHNVGFQVIDWLAHESGAVFTSDFDSLVGDTRIGGQDVLLLKPQTFMNLSGRAVSAAARFYKLDMANVLLISDDYNLPLGRLRIRMKGSAGGHNGLQDVVQQLGTDFPRLRLGIGPVPQGRETKNFVLSWFSLEETEQVQKMVLMASEAVHTILSDGVEAAMNLYNREPEIQKERPS